MVNGSTNTALRQVARVFQEGTLTGLSDRQMLERFVDSRDEAAFEVLVGTAWADGLQRLPPASARSARCRGCLPGRVSGAGSQSGHRSGLRARSARGFTRSPTESRPVPARIDDGWQCAEHARRPPRLPRRVRKRTRSR